MELARWPMDKSQDDFILVLNESIDASVDAWTIP
jgi:hypothetical protein